MRRRGLFLWDLFLSFSLKCQFTYLSCSGCPPHQLKMSTLPWSSVQLQGRLPFCFCQPHEMFCADIAQGRGFAFFRMMETETAFLHHASGFRVAVIIPAPDSCHSQIFETSLQQSAHGFGYQSLPPIRLAYPVSYFGLIRLHFSTMQPLSDYSGLNVPLVAVCNVPPIAFSNVPPQKWLL